jgi:hypothetical protein
MQFYNFLSICQYVKNSQLIHGYIREEFGFKRVCPENDQTKFLVEQKCQIAKQKHPQIFQAKQKNATKSSANFFLPLNQDSTDTNEYLLCLFLTAYFITQTSEKRRKNLGKLFGAHLYLHCPSSSVVPRPSHNCHVSEKLSFWVYCMCCRLRNTSRQQHIIPYFFFLFSGSTGRIFFASLRLKVYCLYCLFSNIYLASIQQPMVASERLSLLLYSAHIKAQ